MISPLLLLIVISSVLVTLDKMGIKVVAYANDVVILLWLMFFPFPKVFNILASSWTQNYPGGAFREACRAYTVGSCVGLSSGNRGYFRL